MDEATLSSITMKEKATTNMLASSEPSANVGEIAPTPQLSCHQPSVDMGSVVEMIRANNDVFGDESRADVRYKTLEWYHSAVLMVTETISLGVLSLPYTLAELGLIPGLTLLLLLGPLATYTGYTIGQFKIAHPEIASMADIGRIIGGRGTSGRMLEIVLAFGAILVLVFIMAAHIATFTIMMNVLTNRATCSIAWSVLGLTISILGGLPRTMKRTSILSVLSCISVVAAVILTMVVVGILKPSPGATQVAVGGSFSPKMVAVLNMILSFSGHVAFPNFASELRDPRDFKKSVCLMMSFSTMFYMVTAVVIYYYVGPAVKSPALLSMPIIYSKIAYGLAAPTIVVAGVVNGHVACKMFYVRWWRSRDSNVMHQKNLKAIGSWILICFLLWTGAWLIAELVPSFHILLALVGALFSGWFSYGITGWMWLHMNSGMLMRDGKNWMLTLLNLGILFLGAIICGAGLVAVGLQLGAGIGGQVFTCEAVD